MPDQDDISVNPSDTPPFCGALSRRALLKLGAVSLSTTSVEVWGNSAKNKAGTFLPFEEVVSSQNEDLQLASEFGYQKIIGFGDPLKSGMSKYNPSSLTAEEQKNRFGGNCDFTHFFPDPKDNSSGVLCVNNETPESGRHPDKAERQKAAYYSVGCSLVKLIKDAKDKWVIDYKSPLNRRITPDTKAVITGPAAGHERLKSAVSKDGVQSAGTLGNCAGGFTPWGTYLTAEENIQDYFTGDVSQHPEKENMQRFGMNGRGNFFHKVDKRFDLNSDSQSPLHFGWIVEIDPQNPSEPIKKHSSLGRAKHECATTVVDKNGHVVVYTGDDQNFEYIYKFVSREKYKANDREHNKKLLENGTLFAAKFNENGSMDWLPLVFGQGELSAKNGFNSQGDVLLDTRKAADLVKATPMDRPEDIAVHPQTGKVYFFMTGNRLRKENQLNAANKVARGSGHIIELTANHHEDSANWSFLVICGQHTTDVKSSTFHPDTSKSGRFIYPDNGCFDKNGQLWVCSDGYGVKGFSDGLWHCSIDARRAFSRRLAVAPMGSELTGPCFMADNSGLLVSVQHPKSKSKANFPDFNGQPARSTVVLITKKT